MTYFSLSASGISGVIVCLSDCALRCCHMHCQTMRHLFIFMTWALHCWPADLNDFKTEILITFNINKLDPGKLFGWAERKWQTLVFTTVYEADREPETNKDNRQTGRQRLWTVCPSACVHACVYMFAMVMLQSLMRDPGLPSLLPNNRCLVQTSWRQPDHMTGSC